jgi:hypothetical protein
MSERRIPISDADLLARLKEGETQQALADDLGVSRWAVRNAADRQRALRQSVAEGKALTTKARKLERRRAKRRGQTPHPSRAPEHGPPVSATPAPSTRKRKSGGGDPAPDPAGRKLLRRGRRGAGRGWPGLVAR